MQEEFEKLTVLINRMNRNIKRIKSREMAEYGLRGAQISCLQYLCDHDGAIASNLCEECDEDKATVSRALNYLEANGFIIRRAESAKRYKCSLHLTTKGREAGKKINEMNRYVLNAIGDGLTAKEKSEIFCSLSIINNNLEMISKNDEKQEGFE